MTKNLKTKRSLKEDDLKVYKTKKEEEVKQWILKDLRDDGRGHHHAKFAKRFEDFIFHIVPQTNDKDKWFTAATSFEKRTIWLGEGFLQNPNLLHQISVLMRHELLHNLLMHEIRMMHKIGDKEWAHIQYSQTIQELINVIADYEISKPGNGYSSEDKIIVKNMTLNGEVIGGLIVEFDRPDWANMTIEEMYEALTQEIADIKAGIAQRLRNYLDQYIPDDDDAIRARIQNGKNKYKDISSPSIITVPIADFMKSHIYKQYPKVIQDVVLQLYKNLVDEPDSIYKKTDFENYLKQIAKSDLMEVVTLISLQNKTIVELYTPEEKCLAIEVLKTIKDFDWAEVWRNKVIQGLDKSSYSDEDIQTILATLEDE